MDPKTSRNADAGCLGAAIAAAFGAVGGGLLAYFVILGPFKQSAPGHVAGAGLGAALEFPLWLLLMLFWIVVGAAVGTVVGFATGYIISALRKRQEPFSSDPDEIIK